MLASHLDKTWPLQTETQYLRVPAQDLDKTDSFNSGSCFRVGLMRWNPSQRSFCQLMVVKGEKVIFFSGVASSKLSTIQQMAPYTCSYK